MSILPQLEHCSSRKMNTWLGVWGCGVCMWGGGRVGEAWRYSGLWDKRQGPAVHFMTSAMGCPQGGQQCHWEELRV